jgi:hypothetical protein
VIFPYIFATSVFKQKINNITWELLIFFKKIKTISF